ncbi:hypothetical protein F383_36643 [Gossypium arboreum]|uniref:Uncharacterized protein n=1 Tax=Gossypium arboreum TaxID=29729 RepID=A0A0B0M5I0_GOSAR|nr:hypothetical protein F383_36643 [Gossypium arboreum]
MFYRSSKLAQTSGIIRNHYHTIDYLLVLLGPLYIYGI